MILRKVKSAHNDQRGEITDILERVDIDCVTLITSAKGARRGDHYHKESDQYLYLLSGRMKAITQMKDGEVTSVVIEPGDLVYTPPYDKHTFVALEESVFLALTKGPRGGRDYEIDTFKLAQPLPDGGS